MTVLKLQDTSRLIQAVFNGVADEVRSLLYAKEDVNFQDSEKRSALHAAAYCGELEICQLLLNAGSRVNIKDNKWLTPLHRACASRHKDTVQILLKSGGDKNARDKSWQTPLHVAAANNAIGCAELLLPELANVNASDRAGHTALHHAVFNGHFDMAQLLLQKGASVNAFDKRDRRALHWAASKGQVEMVQLLVDFNAEVNCRDKALFTPLHVAAAMGHLGCVRRLVDLGAEIDSITVQGNSPLHIACLNGKELVAAYLYQCLSDHPDPNYRSIAINAPNQVKMTPLHLAAAATEGGPCMDVLIQEADVNAASVDGRTPLHMAAIHGRFARAQSLITMGARVDSVDKLGNSPLHVAARHGHDLFVKTMLERGADPGRKGEGGMLALHMAALHGFEDCVTRLLACSEDKRGTVDLADDLGRTAVHAAAAGGSLGCLRFVLFAGGNPFGRDLVGRTPLHLATAAGHTYVANALIKLCANTNAVDNHGCSPLHYAAAFDLEGSLITELLRHDANPLVLAHTDRVGTAGESMAQLLGQQRNESEGYYPLHFAAITGNNVGIDLLIRATNPCSLAPLLRHNPTPTASDLISPILLAASRGHAEAVDRLIRHCRGPPEMSDCLGRTALHLACHRGHRRVARLLLDRGADAGGQDSVYRWNAVHHAAAQGHAETLELLLNGGNSTLVDSLDEHRRTPLMLAVQNGHVDAARILLKVGAEVDRADVYGRTALHRATANGHEECVEALIQRGARLTLQDFRGRSALHMAATCGHVNTLSRVIEAFRVTSSPPGDVTAPAPLIDCSVDHQGYTPLHFAAYNGHDTCVEFLLERPDFREFIGNHFTPLHCAAQNGNDSCLELMLNAYGDRYMNAEDGKRRTPLHAAAFSDQATALIQLLTQGADLNATDHLGRTGLMMAARANAVACLDVLVKHPDVLLGAVDEAGMTALHHAALAKDDSAGIIILDRIDDVELVNKQDNNDRTPAHIAAASGLPVMLETLISKGANLYSIDRDGRFPALACAPNPQVAECLKLCMAAMFPSLNSSLPRAPGPGGQDDDEDMETVALRATGRLEGQAAGTGGNGPTPSSSQHSVESRQSSDSEFY